MFQYPNQNEVLSRNTELSEMQNNIGKKIRFTIYDKKGLPNGEKVGKITSVQYHHYIAAVGKKKFYVSKDDYINIF